MNVIKLYPRARDILAQAAQDCGHPSFSRELLANLEVCDRLLRLFHEDPEVPANLRREIYTSILTGGPGGLLAFSWLADAGHVTPELLQKYAGSLRSGPSQPGALEEREGLSVLEALMTKVELEPEIRARIFAQLLASSGLGRSARSAAFKRVLAGLWLTPEYRREVAFWATAETQPEGWPGPPADLLRPALLGRVQSGDQADAVVRRAFLEIDRNSQVVAEALLDLIDLYGGSLERALRRRALDFCRQQPEARVRRRSYQLAERTEGDGFLKLGLRDQDFGVRSWVMARVAQRRAHTA